MEHAWIHERFNVVVCLWCDKAREECANTPCDGHVKKTIKERAEAAGMDTTKVASNDSEIALLTGEGPEME